MQLIRLLRMVVNKAESAGISALAGLQFGCGFLIDDPEQSAVGWLYGLHGMKFGIEFALQHFANRVSLGLTECKHHDIPRAAQDGKREAHAICVESLDETGYDKSFSLVQSG